MDLKSYLGPMDAQARERFASQCGTSRGHLQNVMYGVRPCAPDLAVSIEKNSEGAVTRKDLRDDWRAIWPELEDADQQRAKRGGGKPQGSAKTKAHISDKPKARVRAL